MQNIHLRLNVYQVEENLFQQMLQAKGATNCSSWHINFIKLRNLSQIIYACPQASVWVNHEDTMSGPSPTPL